MVRALLLPVLAVAAQPSRECEGGVCDGGVTTEETTLLQFQAGRNELVVRHTDEAEEARENSSLAGFSDSNCWDHCNAGWCGWCTSHAGFQGKGMACCRAGHNDPFPCFLTDPIPDRHTCRSPFEYDCWDDCGGRGGHCHRCGLGRACCRTGHNPYIEACAAENVIDGALPMLHPQIISEQHVCRDTKYRQGGGAVVTDAERRAYVHGEFDCWGVCNRRSGNCKMCGPDPYKPHTNRVCCRPGHDHGVPQCNGVTSGHIPHHVCRSSLPPPAPPPPPRPALGISRGEWVQADPGHFTGTEVVKEFTIGVSMEIGGSDEHSVFNEVSKSMEAGFVSPSGASFTVGFSSTTGTEITSTQTWNRVKNQETEVSHPFAAAGGRWLWQWRMTSTNNDQISSAWIQQTKHQWIKPACVPKHFAWGPESAANGAQHCHYGYRLDGTGGDAGYPEKCVGRQQLNPAIIGVQDAFRGWYDVTGCGEALDFCRWVSPPSGGDPASYGLGGLGSFWKCLLSDGTDVSGIDLPGWEKNIAGPLPPTGDPVEPQAPMPNHLRVWNFRLAQPA